MTQYLFNRSNIVSQAIDGYLNVSSGKLARVADKDRKIVIRSDYELDRNNKVAIISGGGSGHEPMHAEFVGRGMLTAAVCGEIFASPSIDAILTAILLVTGDKGCLLVIKNYTGDRLNFALAAERARALGKKVEIVLIADDIAVENPEKRRGIAGTIFIHKLAGYLSDRGFSLLDIKQKCEAAAKNLFSLGLSNMSAADSLSDSEVIHFDPQLGRGIHNEAGKSFSFETPDLAKEAVTKVLDALIAKTTDDRSLYALMINNLGGLTRLEMATIANEILRSTFKDRIKYFFGPASFCTSLNMRGFSLSLLALNDEIEAALLSEVEPRAWLQPTIPVEPKLIDVAHIKLHHQHLPSENQNHRNIINEICNVLILSKDTLNNLDTRGGDGDSGTTLANIATRIQEELDSLPLDNLADLLQAIGQLFSSVGGGSIGVLLSLLFTHAGIAMTTSGDFARGLKEGAEIMMRYAGSKLGDRTMLDALVPAIQGLERGENLQVVAANARAAANLTSNMIAQVGRAANVPQEIYLNFNDSGAEAVAIIFERLADNLTFHVKSEAKVGKGS